MIKRKYIQLHTYNGISARKRNKFESVVVKWMNLEFVMQSEVSQREKYHILMHINGIHRKSPDEPICRAEIET